MTPTEQIRAGLLQQTRHKGDAADKALALLETHAVVNRKVIESLGKLKEYDFSPLYNSKESENEYYEGYNTAIETAIQTLRDEGLDVQIVIGEQS